VYQNVGKTWKTWHLSIMSHHKHKSHSNNRKPTPRISCKPKSVDAKKPLKTCCKTAVNRFFWNCTSHSFHFCFFVCVRVFFTIAHQTKKKMPKKSQQINTQPKPTEKGITKSQNNAKIQQNQSAMFRGSVFLQ